MEIKCQFILRVVNKQTGLFLRDDFAYDESTEVGLSVEPSQGLSNPKWDFTQEKWVEA